MSSWGIWMDLLRIAKRATCPTLGSPDGVAPDSKVRHMSLGGGVPTTHACIQQWPPLLVGNVSTNLKAQKVEMELFRATQPPAMVTPC